MAYVYRHIRLDKNEPFYIGIGSDNNGKYKRAFDNKSNRRNDIWNKIIFKTEYRVEILLDDLTWEEACEKEIEFIKLYGRKNLYNGTLSNLTDGGDGTLNYIVSEETKDLLRKKMSGINNPMYGKSHPKELIEQIRLNNIGREAPNKGVKMSDEQKKKLSDLMKGREPWNKNLKNVNGLGMAKKVVNLSNGIFYESCKEASYSINYKYSTLKSMLNGTNKNKTELIYI